MIPLYTEEIFKNKNLNFYVIDCRVSENINYKLPQTIKYCINE
jgi:hypothetical protein